MALIPSAPWNEDSVLWDHVQLKGVEWPGFAVVEVDRANKWDTKKAKGKNGGERTFNGADLAKVKIRVKLWDSSLYARLTECIADVEPNPGKEKADAISIEHPITTIRKVSLITIDHVNTRLSEGLFEVDIDATEHREPEAKNAFGTASGKSNFNPKSTGICDDLRFLLNNLYGQQIQLAQHAGTLDFKIETGQYSELDGGLEAIQAERASVEANRNQVASEILNVMAQQQEKNCHAQVPSSSSSTTDP